MPDTTQTRRVPFLNQEGKMPLAYLPGEAAEIIAARDTSVASSSTAVAAASTASTVKAELEAIFAGGTEAVNNAATGAFVESDGPTRTALQDTFSRGQSAEVVVFGDSITATNPPGPLNSTWATEANLDLDPFGYWSWASTHLGQRFELLRNSGISGNTTAQMLARVEADVITHKPGFAVVMGGRNDRDALVAPASTTTGNLEAICEAILGKGIQVILGTLLPASTDNTDAKKRTVLEINRWIANYARSRRGVTLCDWYGAWADPATSLPVSGLTTDGVHPTRDGASRLGKVLADAMNTLASGTPDLAGSNFDWSVLSRNPMFLGAAGTKDAGITGDVPDQWAASWSSGSGAATVSKVARKDGIQGFWQQVSLGAARSNFRLAHNNYWNSGTEGRWAPGDRAYIECEIEAGDDWEGVTRLSAQSYIGGQSHQAHILGSFSAGTLGSGLIYPRKGVLRSPVITIGPNAAHVGVGIDFRGNAGTLRIGRLSLRKAPQ